MATEADEGRKRVLRQKITSRLRDAARHFRALRDAQADFGEDFDVEEFCDASRSEDPAALNRVAAIERNVDRLYNYIVEITAFGLELAGLREPDEEPNAPRDLRRLHRAGGLTKAQCERLIRMQELRRLMVHEYPDASPEQVHEATRLLVSELPPFIRAFTPWVKPYVATRP